MPEIDPSRILIIVTRQIGDVLCATPLMSEARRRWPNACIDVLGYEKTMGMLVGNPDINQVIESPEHPNWIGYRHLMRAIFRRYDLALIAQPSDRAHLYGFLAAPRRRGVITGPASQTWWKRLLSEATVVRDLLQQHVVYEALRLMPRTPESDVPQPVSVTPPVAAVSCVRAIGLTSARFAVLQPSTLGRTKQWPNASWSALADRLIARGLTVVFSGSDAAGDRQLIENIMQGMASQNPGHVVNLSGRLSLAELSSVIEVSAVFVGVDTSVTHQAASLGVRTVALYGPSNPVNFGPWPAHLEVSVPRQAQSPWLAVGSRQAGLSVQKCNNVIILQGQQACVPCMKKGCDNHDFSRSECLESLDPEDVFRAISQFLNDESYGSVRKTSLL